MISVKVTFYPFCEGVESCVIATATSGSVQLGVFVFAAANTKETLMESKFQTKLKRELRDLFPGCIVLKNDPNDTQGIPDLIVLWRDLWAVLECKDHKSARRQPNQDYYIDLMDAMSFAAFIYPGNKDQVLNDLQQAFGARGQTRISQRQQVSLGKLRQR